MIDANEAQVSSKSSALFTISVSSGEVVPAAMRAENKNIKSKRKAFLSLNRLVVTTPLSVSAAEGVAMAHPGRFLHNIFGRCRRIFP